MNSQSTFDRVFPACGRTWRIHRANMDELWERMAKDSGEDRTPYWNEIWPSSLAMAGWLVEVKEDIQGKKCLDLGCGLGFTAIVGRWLGADVSGADYEPEALSYAAENERINGFSGINWEVIDWNDAEKHKDRFDRIWAADVMYEKMSARPLAAFFASAMKKGGRTWIAEPGRSVFKEFTDILQEYRLQCRAVCSLPVFPLTAQDVPVPVTLWEINFIL